MPALWIFHVIFGSEEFYVAQWSRDYIGLPQVSKKKKKLRVIICTWSVLRATLMFLGISYLL